MEARTLAAALVAACLAGCVSPALDPAAVVEPAGPLAGLRARAAELALSPGSAGAILVEIGEDEWFFNEGRSVYQASALVDADGASADAAIGFAAYAVSGAQAIPVSVAASPGGEARRFVANLISREPRAATLLLAVAHDDPAAELRVVVGVGDAAVSPLAEPRAPAAWALVGEGARVSRWAANDGYPLPTDAASHAHDVEVEDSRAVTPAGAATQGEVTVRASHAIGAPGLALAMAEQRSRASEGEWELVLALDGEETRAGGAFTQAPPAGIDVEGRPQAFVAGTFDATAETRLAFRTSADAGAYRSFVALSLPLDPAALGYAFQPALDVGRAVASP